MKVLVVDDNVVLLQQVVMQVEDLGHEAVSVMSGSEAYRTVQTRGPFDAIITDMQMKYGTGLELITLLHHRSLEIPCRLHSADDFYMKDGEHVELWEAIKPYRFASFASKANMSHVETFLNSVQK